MKIISLVKEDPWYDRHCIRLEQLVLNLIQEDEASMKSVLGIERKGPQLINGVGEYINHDDLVVMVDNNYNSIGFCNYFDHEGKRTIGLLYVDKEYRRQGVATKLLKHVLSDSGTFTDVGVVYSNEVAIALYKSLGFKPMVLCMTKVN